MINKTSLELKIALYTLPDILFCLMYFVKLFLLSTILGLSSVLDVSLNVSLSRPTACVTSVPIAYDGKLYEPFMTRVFKYLRNVNDLSYT